jgi:hypothetical protein
VICYRIRDRSDGTLHQVDRQCRYRDRNSTPCLWDISVAAPHLSHAGTNHENAARGSRLHRDNLCKFSVRKFTISFLACIARAPHFWVINFGIPIGIYHVKQFVEMFTYIDEEPKCGHEISTAWILTIPPPRSRRAEKSSVRESSTLPVLCGHYSQKDRRR